MRYLLLVLAVIGMMPAISQVRPAHAKAFYLEDIDWKTAADILKEETLVVIPLGAAAKMHGLHLPLSTDLLQAEECARRVALKRRFVMAPTLNYGFYPMFIKYGGSTSLAPGTAVEVVVDVVRSLAGYGPRRFYIINNGISTTPSLKRAAEILAASGILLHYSDFGRPALLQAQQKIVEKPAGGHADELETSNILRIRPDLVLMERAVDDSAIIPTRLFPSPTPLPGAVVSLSGVKGFATPGSAVKGEMYMEAFARQVAHELDSLNSSPLPVARPVSNLHKEYTGTYLSPTGKKLQVFEKDEQLLFIWDGRDLSSFFSLFPVSPDYFTSFMNQVLFVRNDKGKVERAWYRDATQTVWLNREK